MKKRVKQGGVGEHRVSGGCPPPPTDRTPPWCQVQWGMQGQARHVLWHGRASECTSQVLDYMAWDADAAGLSERHQLEENSEAASCEMASAAKHGDVMDTERRRTSHSSGMNQA